MLSEMSITTIVASLACSGVRAGGSEGRKGQTAVVPSHSYGSGEPLSETSVMALPYEFVWPPAGVRRGGRPCHSFKE